ncbi:hypothetical protein ACROYT_G007079 [Oculina patagonica]
MVIQPHQKEPKIQKVNRNERITGMLQGRKKRQSDSQAQNDKQVDEKAKRKGKKKRNNEGKTSFKKKNQEKHRQHKDGHPHPQILMIQLSHLKCQLYTSDTSLKKWVFHTTAFIISPKCEEPFYDSTETTSYAIPLLSVFTNVEYKVDAKFIYQSEDQAYISEALAIIKAESAHQQTAAPNVPQAMNEEQLISEEEEARLENQRVAEFINTLDEEMAKKLAIRALQKGVGSMDFVDSLPIMETEDDDSTDQEHDVAGDGSPVRVPQASKQSIDQEPVPEWCKCSCCRTMTQDIENKIPLPSLPADFNEGRGVDDWQPRVQLKKQHARGRQRKGLIQFTKKQRNACVHVFKEGLLERQLYNLQHLGDLQEVLFRSSVMLQLWKT